MTTMILIELDRDIRNSWIGSYEAVVVVNENKRGDRETAKAILEGLNDNAESHNLFKSEERGSGR